MPSLAASRPAPSAAPISTRSFLPRSPAITRFTSADVRCHIGQRWMMAKRILVPVGNPARAEAIVPVVAALARDGGSTVRLLSVQPLPRTRFVDYARPVPADGYDVGFTVDVPPRVLAYGHAREERLESETLERL